MKRGFPRETLEAHAEEVVRLGAVGERPAVHPEGLDANRHGCANVRIADCAFPYVDDGPVVQNALAVRLGPGRVGVGRGRVGWERKRGGSEKGKGRVRRGVDRWG